ncbi:MAG: ComEC/Rec2 family competence protein [Parcubacteria group bacterium]|jgi:competence protein ComEC
MTKSRIFLILSLSFIVGIFVRSFWEINPSVPYVLSVIAVITLTLFYRNKIILASGCAILFFVGGILLTSNNLEKLNNLNLVGQNFTGTALIIKEPTASGYYQKIVAQLATLDVPNKHQMSTGVKVLINANIYPEYAYGDKIKLNCTLEIPENFAEDFDYRMYLAKDGIFYECKKAKIEFVAHEQGNKFYARILNIKNKFKDKINRLIPSPQAGLLSGLILGGDAGLPKDLQDNFSRTGTTHIIAVSGYNVTIVAEYLMLLGIFLGLWRKQSFWFAVLGIMLFVLMTGMTASAVRAGVMGTLLLWAMKNGRLANAQNAVVFAAGIMLFFNPLLLRYDIGFQLSFLATIGIIYIYPLIESKLNRNSKIFWLWEILFLSLSAQIFVLPIILYNFQTLSLISLVANILVLPIIPLTMLLGFLMAMANFIFTPLASVLAWLTFAPLKYEVEVINFLGNLKYSALEIKNFSWWGMAVWYIIVITIVMRQKKNIYAEQEANL